MGTKTRFVAVLTAGLSVAMTLRCVSADETPYGVDAIPDSSIYGGRWADYGVDSVPGSHVDERPWVTYNRSSVPDSHFAGRTVGVEPADVDPATGAPAQVLTRSGEDARGATRVPAKPQAKAPQAGQPAKTLQRPTSKASTQPGGGAKYIYRCPR